MSELVEYIFETKVTVAGNIIITLKDYGLRISFRGDGKDFNAPWNRLNISRPNTISYKGKSVTEIEKTSCYLPDVTISGIIKKGIHSKVLTHIKNIIKKYINEKNEIDENFRDNIIKDFSEPFIIKVNSKKKKSTSIKRKRRKKK